MGNDTKVTIVRVSAKSRPISVGGAIAKVMRVQQQVEVRAIGAGAVNQAIKGIAIASAFLQQDGLKIACLPHFTETAVDGNERTAIGILVFIIP